MRNLLRLCWLLPALLMAACGGGADKTKAHVRLVNASSGYSALQLQVGNDTLVSSAAYGENQDYHDQDKGSYDASVSRPGSATVLSTIGVSLAKDNHYTLLAYGKAGDLATLLVDENESDADSGKAKVRVINAAPDAGSVDVFITGSGESLADSTALQSAQTYGKLSGFSIINSGTWRVRVTGASNKSDLRLDVDAVVFGSTGVTTLVLTPGRGGVLVNVLQLDQEGAVLRKDNPQARVRVVAGAADSAAVSASVGGTALMSGAASPALTAYSLVTAGTQAVAASAGGTAAALSSAVLTGGGDYTLLVYGTAAAPVAVMVEDDNALPSDNTKSRVRLVNGVADLGDALTLSIDFQVAADGVAQGTASAYTEIDASTTATVGVSGGSTALYGATDRTFTAGANYTVFALGTAASKTGILRKDR